MTAPARQETGVTVDWQHVAKQCGDALDQSGQMVTIHRGALSLALVAVQHLATPTPPRDDAGVETGPLHVPTTANPDFVIALARDGDSWCALIGPNLQEGCGEFGRTPGEAVRLLADTMEAEGAWVP